MESISDKLKSLGVQIGAKNLPKPSALSAKRGPKIEEVVNGYEIDTPYGSIFAVQQDFPPEHLHGSARLCTLPDLYTLSEWNRTPNIARFGIDQFIFIDTETSGLAGGTGTFAFMIGAGFVTPLGFRVIQLFMQDPSEEAALIAAFDRILTPFQAVVTFNGKSFDIPLLKSRYILNQITPPFAQLDHVDILMIARRLWRKRLESCRLGNLENQVLGVIRTQEEVPGWMVPELYFDYLSTGDARPLAGVFYHNSIDILSLAGLFNVVGIILGDTQAANSLPGLDLMSLAQLYEDLNHIDRAVALYEQSIHHGDMPEPYVIQALMRYASIYKHQGRWQESVMLWEKAAEFHQVEACIEIAKYNEHIQKAIPSALNWTERALSFLDAAISSPTSRRLMRNDLLRRQERLLRKNNHE